jgi:Holliday junction resolvase RusA-like endonuclease
MAKRSVLLKINPEINYLVGNIIVPAKALTYKIDEKTHEILETIKPRTHEFENKLKIDLQKELSGVEQFPTKKEVLVSITHGMHAEKEYKSCDLDNRAKTILDAMKGPVYDDDSQVKLLWTEKKFLKGEEQSYYRISVKILDGILCKKISKYIKNII